MYVHSESMYIENIKQKGFFFFFIIIFRHVSYVFVFVLIFIINN